eukprot:maker-scaffold268_size230776-snap-gene-1.38 protein:Tk11103 transcript:maker-scaffold268_size230776-snap-gene-1.38-mRNA-1 annotation:"PREDICTED: translocator protein-like"
MDMINWPALGLMALPFVGGMAGSFITRQKIDTFYRSLRKPWFCPPKEAFPVVWTCLYGTMGYASYLVYRDGGGLEGPARGALLLYGGQLAINWMYTPIFFGMEKIFLGMVNCAALWVAVAGTMKAFYDINPTAGLILIPYQLWVSLATALSFEIWRLNPETQKSD